MSTVTATNAQLIQTLITEQQFNEWKRFILHFARTSLPENIFNKNERLIHVEKTAQRILLDTHSMMLELVNHINLCRPIAPDLLVDDKFDAQKTINFIDSTVTWKGFNELQQNFVDTLNFLISKNNTKKVRKPIVKFDINDLSTTQIKLGLNHFEVNSFLYTFFDLIALSQEFAHNCCWTKRYAEFCEENPNESILIDGHFNVSISKAKNNSPYDPLVLNIKYVERVK
jgi:hypothetical protein